MFNRYVNKADLVIYSKYILDNQYPDRYRMKKRIMIRTFIRHLIVIQSGHLS